MQIVLVIILIIVYHHQYTPNTYQYAHIIIIPWVITPYGYLLWHYENPVNKALVITCNTMNYDN